MKFLFFFALFVCGTSTYADASSPCERGVSFINGFDTKCPKQCNATECADNEPERTALTCNNTECRAFLESVTRSSTEARPANPA